MGCASSKAEPAKVETGRRRLSVGNVDSKHVEQEQSPGAEEGDRGLISQLAQQDIVKMLGDGDGRKMSIGSTTDECKTSFANKSVQGYGDDIDPMKMCLGYTCRKGLKPESPNQDSWFVLKVPDDFSIYAVFDGHGQKGHDVSNFVKENLPKLIVKDPRFKTNEEDMKLMLKDTFKKMQNLISTADRMKKLSAQMSGTTATVVIHDSSDKENSKLTVSHVADSSAVLGEWVMKNGNHVKGPGGKHEVKAVALTRDHKPNLNDERQRIEKNGGRVVFDGYANHRIYAKNARYPGLNMSRCLGDLMGHADCGITAEPEVKSLKIEAHHSVLLVCSDGVWEFITPLEAVQIVSQFPPSNAMQAAEKLAKEAWDRWITEEGGAVVDDITVVCVFLNPDKHPLKNQGNQQAGR